MLGHKDEISFLGLTSDEAYPNINKVVVLQYIEGNRYNKIACDYR